MSGRFLLDTNIVIAFLGGEGRVKEHLARAEEVFVSSIVLGELYFGAMRSTRAEENQNRIDEFAAENTVLGCDLGTAREYGRIKNRLREKGKPIPENDIWIAATARQCDLTLVTRDEHYAEVEGLKHESW